MKLECSKCKKTLNSSKFSKNVALGRGYNYYCKECQQAFAKGKPYTSRWKTNNLDKHYLHQAKTTARRRGLDFNLTVEDTQIPTHCPILGIPLFNTPFKRTENTPSLDRKDNSKGYVKGNVTIISWRANQIKRDASIEEIRKLLAYMGRNL